jgi:hypothetical protein
LDIDLSVSALSNGLELGGANWLIEYEGKRYACIGKRATSPVGHCKIMGIKSLENATLITMMPQRPDYTLKEQVEKMLTLVSK